MTIDASGAKLDQRRLRSGAVYERVKLSNSTRSQRKTPTPARNLGLKALLPMIFMSLLGVYLAWYRQKKIAVGYCGLGRPAAQLIPPDAPVPDFLVPFVEPQCESCPSHAYCHEDFSVHCHNNTIIQPHPLSLGGLVPLPPSCKPDDERERHIQATADKAIDELRKRRAEYECGKLTDEDDQKTSSSAITEGELKSAMRKKSNKRLNSDEFEDVWASVIGEITRREEVVMETTTPSNRTLSSSSLARLISGCPFQRSTYLRLAKYPLPVVFLIIMGLAVDHLRARARTAALVDEVMKRLVKQKELSDKGLGNRPFLSLFSLRDELLSSELNEDKKKKIWQQVVNAIRRNHYVGDVNLINAWQINTTIDDGSWRLIQRRWGGKKRKG